MKHEWRKHEKGLYLPGGKPQLIKIPEMKFFTIHGEGNPNSESFAERIAVLYQLSYAVRMSPKAGIAPDGYFEYTVYPLEGVWDITEQAKKNPSAKLNKDELVYDIMIRQPDFVSPDFAAEIIEKTKKKKPQHLLDDVKFMSAEEGSCIQMLHTGPYDNEPTTFSVMEAFSEESGLIRKSKVHREIYLTDARKTVPDKLKTVLRFQVLDKG
ncbi:MAG TPA: hypothetical protein DCO79_10050 [Spirochaeta sp.]|nr:hypothetical protein [Spirochaeta sp.]